MQSSAVKNSAVPNLSSQSSILGTEVWVFGSEGVEESVVDTEPEIVVRSWCYHYREIPQRFKNLNYSFFHEVINVFLDKFAGFDLRSIRLRKTRASPWYQIDVGVPLFYISKLSDAPGRKVKKHISHDLFFGMDELRKIDVFYRRW